jgi:WS/DGAT/MGAT family acyltransferase
LASPSYERLSTQDASFVLFEGAVTHMHVSTVAIFEPDPTSAPDGIVDIERLSAYVDSRLHRLPRYRRKLAFTPIARHPIWVDDERFNLHYHVRHTALPYPGSEEKLKDLAGRILSQQLDRRKPLWEMWLVEGLEGGRFAAIFKAHHCLVDGAAGVGLLQELLGLSPVPDFDAPPDWSPRPAPGPWELLADEALRGIAAPPAAALRALTGAVRRPQRTSAVVAESAEAVWNALRAGLRLPAETPLNAPIGTHRRVDWCDLDLAAVKEVKKRLDGTVNDVVLAVVTGALRRFLRRRRVPLGRHDFRVVVPVDMRRGPEDRSASNRDPAPQEIPDRRRHRSDDALRRLDRIGAGDRVGRADGLGDSPLQHDRDQRPRTTGPSLHAGFAAGGDVPAASALHEPGSGRRRDELPGQGLVRDDRRLGPRAGPVRFRPRPGGLVRRVAGGGGAGLKPRAGAKPGPRDRR